VPRPLDLDRLRVRPPDVARLTELFYGARVPVADPEAIVTRACARGSVAPVAQPAGVGTGAPSLATLTAAHAEPSIIDDAAMLPAAIAEWRRIPLLALDTETTSLDPMRAELIGMSLAVAPGTVVVPPFAHVAP